MGQEAVGLSGGDDETNLHRQVALQLKEALLMQAPVTTETGQGANGGAAMQPEPLRLLQKPLVDQKVMMAAVLRHVELQIAASHGGWSH